MMIPVSFASIVGSTSLLHAILIPLSILIFFALLMLPGLLKEPEHAVEVGAATFCYLLQGVGVVLMSLGGIPTAYAVLAMRAFPSPIYLSLLFLFIVGGLVFLWHDQMAQRIDARYRNVPHVIYLCSIRFAGALAVIVSVLSILLLPIFSGVERAGWWAGPVVLFVYGILLCWTTGAPSKQGFGNVFRSVKIAKNASKHAKSSKK